MEVGACSAKLSESEAPRRRTTADEPARCGEVQFPSGDRAYGRQVWREVLFSYPRRPLGLRRAIAGSCRGRKNETMKGREESDRRIVPQAGRKTSRTEGSRGGKETTANKQAAQLELSFGTAENPKGADAGAAAGPPATAPSAAPKPELTTSESPPAMTMEEVAKVENLRGAFEDVAANRGAPGPDRISIEEVRKELSNLIPKLREELLANRYEPGMIRRVWIPKPGGGERGLGIPNVITRLVQQALLRVMSPHFEPTFHGSSHGFRPGRSCQTAIAEARTHIASGCESVVDIDLEKFFDRVCHARLMSRLGVRITDVPILSLIRRMLKAQVLMPDGVVVSTEEGVPQGGPLSPLLSNVVLDELDRELERRGHRFVRYADDCNIYVGSERAGHRVMESVRRFVEEKLRLKVNAAKSAVAKPEERHFVGFRIRMDPVRDYVEVLLSKRSRTRIAAKIRELTPRKWCGPIEGCIAQLNLYLGGWFGFFGEVSSAELQTLHNLDAHIRRRLRAILLRQWKTGRTIIDRLVKLGVSPSMARKQIQGIRKGIWALSACTAVNKGLRNHYFKALGLISLEDKWHERYGGRVNAPAERNALGWLRPETLVLDYDRGR